MIEGVFTRNTRYKFNFFKCVLFKGLQRAGRAGPGRAVNRRPVAQLGPSHDKMLGPRLGLWTPGLAGGRAGRAFLNKPKWLLNKGNEMGGFEPLPSSLNFKALTNWGIFLLCLLNELVIYIYKNKVYYF